MPTRTALYRHFNDEGRLLYVGISIDPLKRTADHMQRSYWADGIRSISIEWHASRGAAVDAEERAIATEAPLFNRAGQPAPVPAEYDEDEEMAKLEAYIARLAAR